MSVTVKVEGLSEIQTVLRGMLPDRTARAVMKRVLIARAQPIAQAAEGAAPKRTGQLKRRIGVATRLSPRQRALHRKRDPNDVEVYIGAGPVPQAHLREYGLDHHAAQPFLRPAWDAHRMALLQGVGADMWREIERSVQRLAKRAAKKK